MATEDDKPVEELGVSMRLVRPLALQLRMLKIDPVPVLAAANLSPRNLFAADERVPVAVMSALWEHAVAAAGDPLIGARCATLIDFTMFEYEPSAEYIVLQLMATSATIGEALERLAHFSPLGFGPIGFTIERGPTETLLLLDRPSVVPPVLTEFILLSQVRALQLLPERPIVPLEVRLAHPAGPTEEYEKLIGLTPVFGAVHDAVLLRTIDLEAPLRTSRPALVTALERRAEEELERCVGHSLSDRVRSLLARELEQGNPSAEHVAEALGMSVRSVARKLGELGTSHKVLLDEVRAQAARRLLLDVNLTVEEVARVLGYADASAFHRAFKRWYGSSPAEFRRSR